MGKNPTLRRFNDPVTANWNGALISEVLTVRIVDMFISTAKNGKASDAINHQRAFTTFPGLVVIDHSHFEHY